MRISIVYNEELLYNGLPIADEEVLEYSKAALTAGIPISIDPLNLSFHVSEEMVLGGPSKFLVSELESMALNILLNLRPYPKWLRDLVRDRKFSGLHTVILVAGSGRFGLREELVKYAQLILNTGEEDLYLSRGRFEVNIDADGIYISTGEDLMENFRKVYSMKIHTDGRGVKRYDDIEREDFYNFGKSHGILNLTERFDIDFVLSALEIFRDELVDVRIPKELFWLMKTLGGLR